MRFETLSYVKGMGRINGLADETICHILSFLPTQEAALTSVLSKRWRNLFALTPNLHLDDHRGGGETFIDFVDRVLSVSDNFPMRNISIKCHNSIGVDTGPVTRWMTEAAKHGVMNLDIDVIATEDVIMVPLEIFTCKTIVELKLAKGFEALIPDDVSFPSLKTLYLDSIYFYNSRYCVLGKILSASPVLEELTILGEYWQVRKCDRNISSSTLKKLTMKFTYCIDWWDMILDTPNLVYLEYCDFVPEKYQIVNLESLVKAKLDLRACGHDLTNLVKWLRNVEVLEFLSICNTWRTFCHWHEALPVFINLFRLTITIDDTYYDWEFLPILLNKSPNLHTLVIKGPMHVDKAEREYGSSSVQVLKITEYGGEINELAQMMLFLLKLPCLELVKVRAYAITHTEKSQITNDLLMLPRPSMCKMQITFCEQARPKLKVSKVALF